MDRKPEEPRGSGNRTDRPAANRTAANQPSAGVGKKADLNGTGNPELDPFEINFRPEFREGRGPRGPFMNKHGVVIGDHEYASPDSPLENWSKDTDPSVMSGEEWVHPFKDIGFRTPENRRLFEEGIPPQGGIFMHPDKDAGYKSHRTDAPHEGSAEPEAKQSD